MDKPTYWREGFISKERGLVIHTNKPSEDYADWETVVCDEVGDVLAVVEKYENQALAIEGHVRWGNAIKSDPYMILTDIHNSDMEIRLPLAQTIRPEIMEFAIEMEKEMARHDPIKHDSWKGDKWTIDDFFSEIQGNTAELAIAYMQTNTLAIKHKAIDIANYAMMIWHKAKGNRDDN